MYSSKTFNTKKTTAEQEEVRSWPPRVTYRNAKTGLVERQDPYIMRTVGSKDNRNRVNYVEYPAGSGNLWSKDWKPIGRWDATKPEGSRFLKDEPHQAWAPPETQDQKLAKEMALDKQKIAELERELAAIQAEQVPKKPATTRNGSGA